MWQSFRAIGSGSSEGTWRKKKKETSRAFYKSSRTTVTGGLKMSRNFRNKQNVERLQRSLGLPVKFHSRQKVAAVQVK